MRAFKGIAGLAAVVLLPLLHGCASDRPVYLDVPITRMETPDAGPRGFDAGPGDLGTAHVQLTDDQTTTSPDTAHPQITGADAGQVKVSVNPVPMLSLSGKVHEGAYAGQAKLMPFEPALRGTPVSFALTFNYGSGRNQFDYDADFFGSTSAHTTVHQTLRDYAAIVGVRVAPMVMLYGGPFCSTVRYYGDHQHTNSNESVEMSFSDAVNSRGGNVGVAVDIGSWVRVMGEMSRASVHAGESHDVMWRPGFAVQAFFGSRHSGPVQLRPIPETVKVVPAEPPPADFASLTAASRSASNPPAPALPAASGDRARLLAGALLYDRPQKQAPAQPAAEGQIVALEHYQENPDGQWWYVSVGSTTAWVRDKDVAKTQAIRSGDKRS